MRDLDIWNTHLDGPAVAARWGDQASRKLTETFERRVAKAQSKDHLAALAKLTHEVDGQLRFVDNPPLMMPAESVFTDVYSSQTVANLFDALAQYRGTLSGDRQRLLEKYEFTDLARKVVGVGSVGTRCWVALFVGRDHDDPLFLQIKEAEAAVGEPFLGPSEYPHHGQRVVEGQRLMQGASDIFLGWDSFQGEDGITRHFYLRQMWDWKFSVDVEHHDPRSPGHLRRDLRVDPGPGPRPVGRSHRHGRLSGWRGSLRPGHGRVRLVVRRPEPAGLRRPHCRHRQWCGRCRDGCLSAGYVWSEASGA